MASSDFALVLELSKEGWEFESATPSKKTEPYTKGARKVWFYHHQNKKGGINQMYLTVLLKADALFDQGLEKVHHWQLKAYYSALLAVQPSDLNKILAWQPRSYYQVFLQNLKGSKKVRRRTHFSTTDDDAGGE